MTGIDQRGGSPPHHPLVTILSQVLLPVFRGHVAHRSSPVARGRDALQHVFFDVGGHDLAIPGLGLGEDVLHDHGERIGFFAGGAAGGPDPQGSVSARLLGRQHFRQTVIGERLQLVVLAEHVGFVGGDQVGQRLHFRPVFVGIADHEDIVSRVVDA